MLLFRTLLSGAMVAYIVAVPTGGLNAVARVWAWYATADALAAFLSIAILPPKHARTASLLLQAIWSLGAALIGFLLPSQLLLMLFVVVPLWSVGSTVLAIAGLQQVRTAIEAKWLLIIVMLAIPTFVAVLVGSPSGNTTWLRAALAAGGAASSAVFVLTALSLSAAPER